MLNLDYPNKNYIKSYLDACKEYITYNISSPYMHSPESFNWSSFMYIINQKRYYNLESPPQSTFWLTDDDMYIGSCILRHNLNSKTEISGGHISYTIRPSILFNRNKIEQNFIKMILEKAKNININYALITYEKNSIIPYSILRNLDAEYLKNLFDFPIETERFIINTGLGIDKKIYDDFKIFKKDISVLSDEEIILKLNNIYKDPTDEINIKLFEYFIYLKNNPKEVIGRITIRLGSNLGIYYSGNIGYTIFSKFRGNKYAGKACFILKNMLKSLGFCDKVVITTNPNNIASRKTCDYLNSTFLEVVNIPKDNDMYKIGERQKCRYLF